MFIIHTPSEFKRQVEAQRADLQRRIDCNTQQSTLTPTNTALLNQRIKERGKAIHSYFREHYSLLFHIGIA